jgi:hypothetical protein
MTYRYARGDPLRLIPPVGHEWAMTPMPWVSGTGCGVLVPPKRSQKFENADDENTYGLRFCIVCFRNNAEHSLPYPMVGSGSPHRVNTRIADGLV